MDVKIKYIKQKHIYITDMQYLCTRIMSLKFNLHIPQSLHTKFGSKWPTGFSENPVSIFICKSQEMTLTLNTHILYLLI